MTDLLSFLPTVHLGIAIGTGLVVLFADEQGMEWMRGRRETMPMMRARMLHRTVTTGLVLLMLTGGLLYAQAAPAYLSDPRFVLKMSMLLVVIINSYFVDRFSRVAVSRSFASLSPSERLPLYLSGGASFLGWLTIFVCGLLIA